VAFSLVASAVGASGANGSITSAVDTTGADLLILSVSWYAGGTTTLSVSDSKFNTWIPLTLRNTATTAHRLYYAKNPTVGTGHTASALATGIYAFVALHAYAGADLTAPFDVEAGATATGGSSLATGSVTPAVAGALVFSGWAGMNNTSAPTVAAPLTRRQFTNPVPSTCVAGASADYVQTTAAAINPSWSWTGTDHVAASVAVFKPLAAAVADARITQLVAETLSLQLAPARITQLVAETLSTLAVDGRVTQAVVETLSPTRQEVVFLDGRVSYPLCWLEYTDRVGDRYVFAEVDLNDRQAYYGGYKRPWVTEFLAITRGISDPTGQLEHLAFGARLSDTTRFFRGQLADPDRRYVANRPLVERMIDDEDRRAERLPRIVAVGYAKSPQVLPSLQVQLPGTDWIAKKFIRKQRQEEDWIARVTAADFPTAPPAVLDQTIPILYGEVSDETATGATLTAPTTLHARVFGTVSDPVTKRFYVTGMTGEFGLWTAQAPSDHRGETDAAWIDVAGCPSDAELAEQQASGSVHAYVEINWECAGAVACRVYKSQSGAAPKFVDGADYGPGFPPPVTPGDPGRSWGYIPDTNPNADFFFLDGERPYGAAELNTYKLDGDPPFTNATGPGDTGSGIVPVIYVGTTLIGGLERHQFLVAACALKQITSVYSAGVRLTTTQRDTSFRVPGTAIWSSEIDAAHTYVDINTHRYTIIYGVVGDLVADAAASGNQPLTLNAWGIEEIGDGTGALIRLLARQEQHFARNYLAAEPSYRGGDWLTATPEFPGVSGLALLDDTSFETVAVAFPVEGAGMLAVNNQAISGTTALGSFHLSGDWEGFFNRRGQLALTREPDAAPDAATATTLTDVVNVVANSFRITDQYDADFANILPYTHTRDYAGLHKSKNGWLSGDLTIADATSATGYEQERRSNPWALEWLRAPLAAANIMTVMTRKLARTTNPLRQAQLKLSYEGLSLEVGDVCRFTHAEGIGAEGWVNRWVRVMRHEVQPSAGIVSLEVYDLELVWAARDELVLT
jgi:hypothetical protein